MKVPIVRPSRSRQPVSARFFVLTISDTRTRATDEGGPLAVEYLEANGHRVTGHEIVKDEPAEILDVLKREASNPEVEFFLLTGGTGISRRDQTFEAVHGYLDREIIGFGEIFRWLSYQDIGSPAILSRALAGLKGNQVIISLPGSPSAVRLAMEKLVLPEIGHILAQLKK